MYYTLLLAKTVAKARDSDNLEDKNEFFNIGYLINTGVSGMVIAHS